MRAPPLSVEAEARCTDDGIIDAAPAVATATATTSACGLPPPALPPPGIHPAAASTDDPTAEDVRRPGIPEESNPEAESATKPAEHGDGDGPIATGRVSAAAKAAAAVKCPARTRNKARFPSKSSEKIPVKSSCVKAVAKPKRPRKNRNPKGKAATREDAAAEDGGHAEEDPAAAATAGIEFSPEDFPQLVIDEREDQGDLCSAFKRPLFDDPSRPLEIAYSHLAAARAARRRTQRKTNEVIVECDKIQLKLEEKQLELSLANEEVRNNSRKVGSWTRKVFDLELDEDCAWNENYRKLKEYKEKYGRLPVKKTEDEEERKLAGWLDRIRFQKSQEDKEKDLDDKSKKKHRMNKNTIRDYPHRLERLADIGVHLESKTENKWETMFQKLCEYKEEMGTLRFPSDDQCAATGDASLIILQRWVKSQVLNFRYGRKRNPEVVRKLLDIGFDFEKWYAKPTKKKTRIGDANEIARSTLEEMEVQKS